jgi:hypothetical protein
MKKVLLLASAILVAASTASAQVTTQKFVAGWDNFGEPLNFTKSNVKWSVTATTHKLTVTYNLVGARPSKLYQVSINFFCSTFPATFGQFPNDLGAGSCFPLTRQGVTGILLKSKSVSCSLISMAMGPSLWGLVPFRRVLTRSSSSYAMALDAI